MINFTHVIEIKQEGDGPPLIRRTFKTDDRNVQSDWFPVDNFCLEEFKKGAGHGGIAESTFRLQWGSLDLLKGGPE